MSRLESTKRIRLICPIEKPQRPRIAIEMMLRLNVIADDLINGISGKDSGGVVETGLSVLIAMVAAVYRAAGRKVNAPHCELHVCAVIRLESQH